MKSITFILLSLALLFTACSSQDEVTPEVTSEISAQDAFFANLSSLCGETFTGAATYPEEGDHVLVGTTLRNYVSACTEDMVRIELYRKDGTYWHGAWVIEKRPEGLHLFHDHLGEERTMEYLIETNNSHGYGGYATDAGSATRQFFAADEVTADMLPEASTNVWMMDINLEEGVFTYYLERHELPRFRAVMRQES
jgi:hypothetical protein